LVCDSSSSVELHRPRLPRNQGLAATDPGKGAGVDFAGKLNPSADNEPYSRERRLAPREDRPTMSGQLGAVKNDYGRLWEAGTVSGMPDAQLLERFAAHREDLAFAAIVARHGPLVWAVCRSVLRDPHDVEDAFQATFLILARKADSLWIGDSLCRWLYRVSYRVAQQARAQRDRRRRREQAVVERVAIEEERESHRDEVLSVLDHEINRLPEKYRLPIVLCRLDGLTRIQAAEQLGWPPGTVATRLTRGQDLLGKRMRKRLGHSDERTLCVLFGGSAAWSVPAACRDATVRAATALGPCTRSGAELVTSASALARGAQWAMFWANVRSLLFLGLGLVAGMWFTTGWLHIGPASALAPQGRGRSASQQVFPRNESERPQPAIASSDAESDRVTLAGLVLDPAGKPLSGATVYLDLSDNKGVVLHKLQISGADGRFRVTVSRRELTRSQTDDPWKHAYVVVTAPGCGPVWAPSAVPAIPGLQRRDDLTLRMAPDDVPIEGRIITAEGRPVEGTKIRAFSVKCSQDFTGAHIPWDSKEGIRVGVSRLLQGLVANATTDADGHFVVKGLGRDRLVTLWLNGPRVAQEEIQVQTRRSPTKRVEAAVNGRPVMRPIYGASFVHIAEPGRSIQGVVRERGTRKPIAGALANTLETDAEGRFQIDGLFRQFKYRLEVLPPAGIPYFRRRLIIESDRPGLEPVLSEVELSRGTLVRGRLTDKANGKPIRGRVYYAPFKGNPNAPETLGYVENGGGTDETGRFTVVGVPGMGVLIVTAGVGNDILFPRLRTVSPEHQRRGLAVPDDNSLLDTMPRPINLIGTNAYRVIDVPGGRDEWEVNFQLTVKPGRTLIVRVVDPLGRSLEGVTAFGLREPTLNSYPIRGDGPFVVHDLDPGWPRRVFFYQPERDLAGFLDLSGNESGDAKVRLSPCGSILGRIVDGEGRPIEGACFALVYDDAQGIPHIGFPTGGWVPTVDEARREKRTNPFFDPMSGRVNIPQVTREDGRFRISAVVSGAKLRLTIIMNQVARRLGPMATVYQGEKLLCETTLTPDQVFDLGDVRIQPEELRGDPAPALSPPSR
jgi:RNA polymerase sigma factor (sigma-70 family)